MPRYPIEPKFTYSQGVEFLNFPPPSAKGKNHNIYNKATLETTTLGASPFCFPQYVLPERGNNHNQRHGNRITITSIRTKINIVMSPDFSACLSSNLTPFDYQQSTDQTYLNEPGQKRFMKMRYFLVQFDDDLVVTPQVLSQWFYSTYCYFRSPDETITDLVDAPISVHSNVLRITTPFTAKFNILCDRCFTLVSSRPSVSFDITVPLNKQYIFEEGTDNLIHPNIWQFVMPPLNWLVDVDPLTWLQYIQNNTMTYNKSFANFFYFTKLNFVDL